MLHTSDSDDGVGSQPKVPDKLKEKTTSTNEGTGTIPGVLDVPKDQSESENESWGDSGDDDDSNDDDIDDNSDDDSNNDETNYESKEFDEEEYEELYGDFNISLKYVEHADKEKVDMEMIVVGQVNVNQEGAGNLVKDDAQATQKTKGPISSSSISSDYAAKYLNFDNIPPVDTEVISMLDINVQHEVPHTSPLLTIPVSVI
ncbi:hypothetical protein Tco_0896536 [Tanacetum coccineum]